MADLKWRVANALHEAYRCRKKYGKTDHLVTFDYLSNTYGLLVLTEKYETGQKYDVIRVYEMHEGNPDRRWIFDVNADTKTFEKQCSSVLRNI